MKQRASGNLKYNTILFYVFATCLAAGTDIAKAKSLYLVVYGQGGLYRADVTSSGIGSVNRFLTLTETGAAGTIDFARANGRIYWSDASGPGRMRSSLPDGTDMQVFAATPQGEVRYFSGVAIDNLNSHVYFSDKRNNAIYRASLDGSNIQTIIAPERSPSNSEGIEELKIDIRQRYLYWADSELGSILRANLDGSDVQSIVNTPRIHDFDLDLTNGKIYWTERRASTTTSGRIMRSNLDGTQVEAIINNNLWWPTGVAVDPSSNQLFWTDTWFSGPTNYPGTLQTATLTGENRRTVHSFGFSGRPVSLTFVIPEPACSVFAAQLVICLVSRRSRCRNPLV